MNIAAALPPGKYRLRIEDYLGLAQSGSFGSARTELIEGDVIIMAPEFLRHGFVREELVFRLRQTLKTLESSYYPVSASVLLSEHSMPQPDIVLTSNPRVEGPIILPSIALVIEISVSTLSYDSRDKAALYARAAIPEYWVVDVSGRTIHQLWQPEAGAYTQHRTLAFDQPIVAITLPGLGIETTGL